MAGEYAVLLKATRGPMARWWARCGVWWLVVITLCFIKLAVGCTYLGIDPLDYTNRVDPATAAAIVRLSLLTFFPPPWVMVTLCWLHAGITAMRLSETLPETAEQGGQGMLRAKFILALMQGWLPLALACVVGVGSGLAQDAYLTRHWYPTEPGSPLPLLFPGWDIHVLSQFQSFAEGAWFALIEMFWLFALAVLVPQQRIKCWLLLLLPLAFGPLAVAVSLWDVFQPNAASAAMTPWTGSWLIGAAVVIGMLAAFRYGSRVLGNMLYYTLLVSLCAEFLLWRTYSLDQSAIIAIPAQFTRGVAHFYSSALGQAGWFAGRIREAFPTWGSVLGYLEYVRPVFLWLAWLALMFAIVYYVILRPGKDAPDTQEPAAESAG